MPSTTDTSALDWWSEAFPILPYQKSAPAAPEMLSIVAYDISNARRLAKVAHVCENWGIRVQYSVFECRLEENEFQRFWKELLQEIDEKEDKLVAYKIDARCARETLTAGQMTCSEKVVCYMV